MKIIALVLVALLSASASAEDKGVIQGVIPSGSFDVYKLDANTVLAQGTWMTVNPAEPLDRVAYPVNFSKIQCERRSKVCVMANADVQDNQYLWVDLFFYDMTKWTDTEVVFEDAGLCVSSEVTINLIKKEVFQISREGGISKDGCANMPGHKAMKAPLIMKLSEPLKALRADPRIIKK